MKIFNGKKFIRMEVIRLAQRGRKPKPTAVKQLEGNPGKRQLNANEPKPVARAPSCPKWLEDDAEKGMETSCKTDGTARYSNRS